MRLALLSNPIKIKNGDWGEITDLAGVMKELMYRVIKYLQSKGRDFLERLKIYYAINDPFDRNTQRDHQDNLYDLDNVDVKIEMFYENAKKHTTLIISKFILLKLQIIVIKSCVYLEWQTIFIKKGHNQTCHSLKIKVE